MRSILGIANCKPSQTLVFAQQVVFNNECSCHQLLGEIKRIIIITGEHCVSRGDSESSTNHGGVVQWEYSMLRNWIFPKYIDIVFHQGSCRLSLKCKQTSSNTMKCILSHMPEYSGSFSSSLRHFSPSKNSKGVTHMYLRVACTTLRRSFAPNECSRSIATTVALQAS